ncbi:MAG: transcriptional repressor [Chloroflexi bacterium]|nr:transcriptional repressor [Chloroflexota bacterium]
MKPYNAETRYQELVTKLKERGHRITSHRLALLRLLAESDEHPNASRLYEKVKVQFPTVSLATIYKTLTVLKEEGDILQVDLQNDSHFDGKKPYPHPHLVCTRCDRIFDADDTEFLGVFSQEIEEKHGFKVSRHQIVFYGVCNDCQNLTV